MDSQEAIPQSIRRRIIGTLFTAQSLFSAAQIVTFTLLPIIAVELSGSASAAGIPATLGLLGRAAAAYPMGWLMDRYGRRAGLSLGYLLAAAGAFLSALAIGGASFLGFCLGAILAGTGRATGEQARFAAAEVVVPARRAKVIGLVVFAGTVGAIAGPLLVAPSIQWAAARGLAPDTGPYLVGAVLTGLAMLVVFALLRPDPMLISQELERSQAAGQWVDSAVRTARQIFSENAVRLAVLAMVIGQLVMTLIMVITPLHMKYSEYDPQQISWVIMAHTLGMFGLSSVTGRLIDRFGQVSMIGIGALVLIVSALLTPPASSVAALAVALFLLGLGWNFCFIAGSSLLTDALSPHERGRIQGVNETLVALASGAGSLSTGVVFSTGGMLAISLIGVVLSAGLIGAAFYLGRGHASPAPVRQ